MFKALALLAIVAAAAASQGRHHGSRKLRYDYEWLERVSPRGEGLGNEGRFMSGKQYDFVYNGQLMTGIPGASEQHSASRIQAIVSLQFKTEHMCYMQMKHVRFGYANERVSNPRRMHAFETFEPIEVSEEQLEQLALPVKFHYKNGLISSVHFAGAELPWSANMKRAVLNMLQVNLKKERVINEDLQRLDTEEKYVKKNDFFTTIEKSIEGECETAYTVESTPARFGRQQDNLVLNVTKSINFENCARRPETRYNFRFFSDVCPTCEKRYSANERVLRSSTIVKQNMTVCEDRSCNLIESAIVESHYSFVPLSEEGSIVQTYVNQTIVLVNTGRINEPLTISEEVKSDSDLIYTPDWDITKERFFMEGEENFLEKTPYSELKNKVAFVKSILNKLVNYMRESVEEEAPRQYARLVKVLRMLTREEIERVHEEFIGKRNGLPKEAHKKVEELLIDAIGVCGTKSCVEHLIRKIETRDIPTIKATMLLRKLTGIRTVSKPIIERVWSLINEERCSRHVMLCQSASLATGSLLRAVCAPSKDKLALQFKLDNPTRNPVCNEEMKREWIEKLFGEFERCETETCRVTMLKTIGNAGIDLSVYKLEKIIKNKNGEYSQMVRVEAILATRLLCNSMPRKVEKILMPIYMNKMERPYVRMAAFNKIMQCQPEKFIVDQLTRSLLNERQRQVASFVYTSLQTMANATSPCEKRFADDIKLSLRHARYLPVWKWMRESRFLRMEYHSTQMNRGFAIDFNAIMGNYSVIPKDVAASLHTQFASSWQRFVATIGINQNNMERYIRTAVRKFSHHLYTPLDALLKGKLPKHINPKFNGRKELSGHFDSLDLLSIETDVPEFEAFASIYLRFFDQDYMFLPLSKDIVPQPLINFVKNGLEGERTSRFTWEKIGKLLAKALRDTSFRFNTHSATFMHETSRKVPTSLGLPLQLSSKSPSVAQASGIVKINVDESAPFAKFSINMHGFKPSFVLSTIDKVEIWSPIVNTGLKVVAHVKAYLPFDGSLQLDAKKTMPTVKFTWSPSKTVKTTEGRAQELIRVETRPITTVLVWPRFLKSWQEPLERTIQGEEWTRTSSFDKSFGRRTFGVDFVARSHWHYSPMKKVPTTPCSVIAGPNKFVLYVRPGVDMPKHIEFELSSKLFNNMNKKTIRPDTLDNFFDEEGDEYLQSTSTSTETSNSEEFETYYNDFEGERPTQHKIVFKVTGKGSPVERRLVAEALWMCDEMDKTCKANVKVVRTPIPQTNENSMWKLLSTIETLYPKTPMNIKELSQMQDKKFISRINAKWGLESSMDKYIDLKIVGEQSDALVRVIENTKYYKTYTKDSLREKFQSLYSPVAQYEQCLKYGIFDQYKMDLDYKMSPWMKNVTEKVFNLFKYNYYFQTYINGQPENIMPEGQVVAKLNIDPINRRYVNVTIKTPKETVRMYDMPLWTAVRPMNVRRFGRSPARSFAHMIGGYVDMNDQYSMCQIRSDRVKTFDQVSYRAPISTCYSLITKDCSSRSESQYAVFVKKINNESEKKQMKIVTENMKLVVKPMRNSLDLECTLNGKTMKCNKIREQRVHLQHTHLRVLSYASDYIKIELPEEGIRVYFDGYAINVKLSPFRMERTCGLCGHYDEEETCDLRTAQEGECVSARSPSQLKKFYRSYLHTEDECELNEEFINNEENYEWQPIGWEQEEYNSFDNEDECECSATECPCEQSVRRRSSSFTVTPRRLHRVVEHLHEVCISKRPLAKCPRNSYAVRRQEEPVEVAYTCFDRNTLQAERYLRLVWQYSTLNELKNMETTFTKQEFLPELCRNGDL